MARAGGRAERTEPDTRMGSERGWLGFPLSACVSSGIICPLTTGTWSVKTIKHYPQLLKNKLVFLPHFYFLMPSSPLSVCMRM